MLTLSKYFKKKKMNSDIAIIGMAGRFPGAQSIEQYWKNLCEGKESIKFFTDDELEKAGIPKESCNHPDYVKASPILEAIDLFDAKFFHCSPREARILDPQQRLLLECAYEALENAGYPPYHSSSRNIGVFCGSGGVVTSYLLACFEDDPSIQGASGSVHHLGNDKDFLSTRISYKLNLKGPSITVQTACSTSLVSVHLACQSILRGESEMVLAGGMNIRIPHLAGYFKRKGDIFSVDGHCRPFDANAQGIIFGSGGGFVLLKSLDKAINDQDFIYAVIKGTAINNDGGNKISYMASSQTGQVDCIAEALRVANVNPNTITYIEAHGTGTVMGDPVEVTALTQVFKRYTLEKQFCAIGSVKSNIGHLEMASGIASLIKVVLCLHHKKIPPHINFDTPNPKIDISNTPFYVNTELKNWEKTKSKKIRRAGVNSLGIGGTNAFAILEEVPLVDYLSKRQSKPYYLITLSAENKESLKQRFEELLVWLDKHHQNYLLEDISFTLNAGRDHFIERYVLIVSSISELRDVLLRPKIQKTPSNELLSQKEIDALLIKIKNKKITADEYKNILTLLGNFYMQGGKIDWAVLHQKENQRRIPLPTYPYVRERYWLPKSESILPENTIPSHLIKIHPLIDEYNSVNGKISFSKILTGEEFYLIDHVIQGNKILPGVVYLEMARAAGELAGDKQKKVVKLQNVVWMNPVVSNDNEKQITLYLTKNDAGTSFEISSDDLCHAQGKLIYGNVGVEELLPASLDIPAIQGRCKQTLSASKIYQLFKDQGIYCGPSFQSLQYVKYSKEEVLAELLLPEQCISGADRFILHPSLLDGAFEAVLGLLVATKNYTTVPYVPFSLEELTINAALPGKCYVYVTWEKQTNEQSIYQFHLTIADKSGKVVASLRNYGICALNTKPETMEPVVDKDFLLNKLQDKLVNSVTVLLGLNIDSIDLDAQLSTYDMDSINFITLTNDLNQFYSLNLSPTILFEYGTLRKFSRYLLEKYFLQIENYYRTSLVEQHTLSLPSFNALSKQISRDLNKSHHAHIGDVAVIGIGGVFPQSSNLIEFWNNLIEGRDLISEIPTDRWDWRACHMDTKIKWGGFIDDIDKFDASFFNISPREAELMDPQQRIFLQTVWNAIEDAGYPHEAVSSTVTGLFVGVSTNDYAELLLKHGYAEAYATTGTMHSILANRVSYFLNLRGPSEAIDAACASSLIAIHHAVMSIQNGDCELAIAGGVNALLTPTLFSSLSKAGMLCEDGRCKTFDKSANGYVRGEGAGAILLKPLSKALADNDHIYGVIKACAINHGGHVSSLTVPNPNAQADLLVSVYNKANIPIETISYIEAHGTGTSLGDPIEINGLKRAFSILENKEAKRALDIFAPYCGLGTVKTNIGHLEATAGVVGIIKILLAMQHGKLPGNCHFKELNSYIQLDGSPFYIVEKSSDWPRLKDNKNQDIPRRAGISSFGFGGSNAHIVIEESPQQLAINKKNKPYYLITLSAKNPESLRQKIIDLTLWIKTHVDISIENFAYTLNAGRTHFIYRCAVVASTLNDLQIALEQISQGKELKNCFIMGKAEKITTDDKKAADTQLKLQTMDFNLANEYRENLLTLGDLYVTGITLDWNLLHCNEVKQRISLPTYSFLKEHYWLSKSTDSCQRQNKTLHPLIGWNVSTLEQACFKSKFDGNEFYFEGHKIHEEKILPGVVYLEMARAAGQFAMPGKTLKVLRNIAWLQPLKIGKQALEITISLRPSGEDIVTYSIWHEKDNKKIIYGQGELVYNDANLTPPGVERLEHIQIRLPIQFSIKHIYEKFNQLGLHYGEAMQSLVWIKTNGQEALAHYCLPEMLEADKTDYVLHPSLLDSALQTIFGLLMGQTDNVDTLQLPFALDALKIYNPLSSKGYIYVRSISALKNASISYDLQLFNHAEQLSLELNSLYTRPMSSNFSQENRPELNYYVPAWLDQQAVKTDVKIKSLCVFTEDSSFVDVMRRHFTNTVIFQIQTGTCYQVLAENKYQVRADEFSDLEQLIKSIIQAGYSFSHFLMAHRRVVGSETDVISYIRLEFYYTVSFIQSLIYQHVSGPIYFYSLYDSSSLNLMPDATLAGFAKSLQLEYPQYQLRLIGADIKQPSDILIDQLKIEFLTPITADVHVRYINSNRQVLRYKHVEKEIVDAISREPVLLRKAGVYIITGGCGGLGYIIAQYLAENYQARIILTGRSPLDESKKDKILKLKNLGAEVHYFPGDVTRQDDVEQWISKTKTLFGTINGIIHSAGIIQDSFLINKKRDVFGRVLSPKIVGSMNLDMATQREPLDYFILFSSISGCFGNMGQCDYASANAYLDVFANWRQAQVNGGERYGKTISISWPLWAEGGMQLDEVSQETLKRNLGLVRLPTDLGLKAFRLALQQPNSHWIVFYGLRNILKQNVQYVSDSRTSNMRVPVKLNTVIPSENNVLYDHVIAYLKETLALILKQSSEKIGLNTPFVDYGIDSIIIIEITRLLEQSFGLLPKTLFFEYKTLSELAAYFMQNHARLLQERFSTSSISNKPLSVSSERTGALSNLLTTIKNDEKIESIAIIGLSGRYPMADNLDQFWENLKAGKNCITEIPPERWDYRLYYDPDKDQAGKTYSKWGGFLKDIDKFDPLFFGITPREAELLDPQERLFLEVVWEALEDAGYTPEQLQSQTSSQVGMFVGVMYGLYQLYGGALNSSYASIANRASYHLNLKGPSFAIDSMCSSSLTAIHLACESLRRGECQVAFAGGVNIASHPNKYLLLSQGHFLASDGLCKSFGEGGDGYVPGEGVGAILLKPLSRAEADGDQIYGIIRGTAINHGGKTNGYTVPSPIAQAELVQEAIKRARIEPESIGYIEAHGTGTTLGDPIEIRGLSKVFETILQAQSCPVGSIKSNIGHLESAAGIAALTKVLLQFKHKQLVPSIHSKTLNPYIDFANTPFYVQQSVNHWAPVTGYPRRAGISSFGAGGSNAHIILEEALPLQLAVKAPLKPFYLITLSAKHVDSLWRRVQDLAEWIRLNPDISLEAIAYTLNTRRVHFSQRYAVVARSLNELREKLDESHHSKKVSGCFYGDASIEPDDAGIYKKILKSTLAELANQGYFDINLYEENLVALANLYVKGYDINWMLLHKDESYQKCHLPVYPFLKERYWITENKSNVINTVFPVNQIPASSEGSFLEQNKNNSKHSILTLLKEVIHKELKISPDRINITESFDQIGLDSVLVIQLTRSLENFFGKLPATLFFKYKNLDTLSDYFLESHFEKIKKIVNVDVVPIETIGLNKSVKEEKVDAKAEIDIAIIGVSGQFPMAQDIVAYWENLKAGKNCITDLPKERWGNLADQRKIYCKWGGFIEDVDKFDASFFNISPRDAKWLDPQERLFLQCVWSCLESAGYTKSRLLPYTTTGSRARVGVFAGAGFNNYQLVCAESKQYEKNEAIVSSQIFSIANRVSYYFDFKGPSLTIDTACSSSLYAVHLACESIKRNECLLAIAGGVNLTLHPSKYITLCETGFAASDGLCHPFGEGGDGYVPGEAIGAVLLKPLSQAIKDGDQIHAVIKGTAVSHDGKTHGYTVPNPVAQSEAIQLALEKAEINPRTISYLEAHGTGTTLGDPVEITGLCDVYQSATTDKQYCAIGSVKSNIGHSEAAAGMAQLIKVILQMKHKMFVPTLLHSRNINPHIDFANSPFYVQQKLSEWLQPTIVENGIEKLIPRRAGISSFGAGGVNIHAIIEEYISDNRDRSLSINKDICVSSVIIPLSAKTEIQLKENAENLKNFLKKYKDNNPIYGAKIDLLDLAYTLQVGKEAMQYRLAFAASTLDEVIEKLDNFLNITGMEPFASNEKFHYGKVDKTSDEDVTSVQNAEVLAKLWVNGSVIQWHHLYDSSKPTFIYLPTYSFAKDRHWAVDKINPLTFDPKEDSDNEVKLVHRSEFLLNLSEMTEVEQNEEMRNYCQQMVADVLEYEATFSLDVRQGFFELGMESLQAVKLQKIFETQLNIKMSDTALFDYPTVEKLANYLLQLIPFDNLKQNSNLDAMIINTQDYNLLTTDPLPNEVIKMIKEEVELALGNLSYKLDVNGNYKEDKYDH